MYILHLSFLLLTFARADSDAFHKHAKDALMAGALTPIKIEGPPMVLTNMEEAILKRSLKCPNTKRQWLSTTILRKILYLERTYEIPTSLRGMTLAAACSESGFRANASGDYRYSKKRTPLAIGILQLWPWWEKAYDIDRRNPLQSATAWLTHIDSLKEKVRRQCRLSNKNTEHLWVKSWVTGIRSRKKGGRCNETPKHYTRLVKWRRSWRKYL